MLSQLRSVGPLGRTHGTGLQPRDVIARPECLPHVTVA